jgi:hypothetical protein
VVIGITLPAITPGIHGRAAVGLGPLPEVMVTS